MGSGETRSRELSHAAPANLINFPEVIGEVEGDATCLACIYSREIWEIALKRGMPPGSGRCTHLLESKGRSGRTRVLGRQGESQVYVGAGWFLLKCNQLARDF